jgi:hypothetical protein
LKIFNLEWPTTPTTSPGNSEWTQNSKRQPRKSFKTLSTLCNDTLLASHDDKYEQMGNPTVYKYPDLVN